MVRSRPSARISASPVRSRGTTILVFPERSPIRLERMLSRYVFVLISQNGSARLYLFARNAFLAVVISCVMSICANALIVLNFLVSRSICIVADGSAAPRSSANNTTGTTHSPSLKRFIYCPKCAYATLNGAHVLKEYTGIRGRICPACKYVRFPGVI